MTHEKTGGAHPCSDISGFLSLRFDEADSFDLVDDCFPADLARFGGGACVEAGAAAAAAGGGGEAFFALRLRRLRVEEVEVAVVVVEGPGRVLSDEAGCAYVAVAEAEEVLEPGGKAEPLMSLAVERVTLRGGMNK